MIVDIRQDNVDCRAELNANDFSVNLFVGKDLQIKMTCEQWEVFTKGQTIVKDEPPPAYKIFIREQSDSYWLNEKYPTEEAAMEERRKIHEGPLGGGFMVMVYSPDGKKLTER